MNSGCSVSDLLRLCRKFKTTCDPIIDDKVAAEQILADLKAPITEADLNLGRAIWSHIVATGKVTVGPTGKWNHLTFDEVISVHEENDQDAFATDARPVRRRQPASKEDPKPKKKKLPKIRPRLHVDDELVWMTLTGHGENFVRVPMMEWKLLMMIASMQEEGILQGDLVRATGQDKRSVPRRTDFLSYKGYIVKRTHMVRGSKTSKLWLKHFAPRLPPLANPLHGLNITRGFLTRDMEPVPWHHQWVNNKDRNDKDQMHYMALCQTIVAIIKAWGTLRLRDLKRKLGIKGLKWQMRTTCKFLRKFDELGNMAYVVAGFPGNSVVFKDCVKYVRDPTEADWQALMSTGKRTSGPYRPGMGKKKKAKGKARGRKPAPRPKAIVRRLKKKGRIPPKPTASQWEPEKPLANSIAEFVLTGGEQGYTAKEVTDTIASADFHDHLLDHLTHTSALDDAQPTGAKEYQMSRELVKSRKAKSYAFVCTGARKSRPVQITQEESAVDPVLTGNENNEALSSQSQSIDDPFGFAPVEATAFREGTSSLTALCKIKPKVVKPKRPYKPRRAAGAAQSAGPKRGRRKKAVADQPAEDQDADVAVATSPPAPTPASAPRPTRKRKAAQRASYSIALEGTLDDFDTGSDGEPSLKRRAMGAPVLPELPSSEEEEKKKQESEESEEEQEQDRTQPGVYWGIPGSLNRDPKKKGRPRKSIVLIFRSDKIKDSNYLPGWADYPKPRAEPEPELVRPVRQRKTPSRPPTPQEVQFAIQGLREDQSQAQPSENGQLENLPVLQPVDAAQQAKKGPIVAQNFSALHGAQQTQVQSSTSIAPVEATGDAPSPALIDVPSIDRPSSSGSQKPVRNSTDKYVCATCGGSWANENGLRYHQTKGKNLCNPYYREHPEELVRKKGYHSVPDATFDPEPAACPSSPESSQSSSYSEALGPISSPRLQPKKPNKAKKKKQPPSRRIDPNDPNDPANRPGVKRQILKSRPVGVGITEPIPRGVAASEAAAQEAAAAKYVEVPMDLAMNSRVDTEPAEDVRDEDLAYYKYIQAAQAARQPKQPTAQSAEASSSPTVTVIDSAYPANVLDPTNQTGSRSGQSKATNLRKALPGNRPGSSGKNTDSAANGHRYGGKAKPQRNDRIREIIMHLVKNSGGVFPTGRALYWGVLKFYLDTEQPPYPTLPGCSRALSKLVEDGELRTLTTGLNNSKVQWYNLTAAVLPDITIGHRAFQDYKNTAIEAEDPLMFLPGPFRLTEAEKSRFQELEKPVQQRRKGPGRRDHKLVEGIQTLNAAWYQKVGLGGLRPGRTRNELESSDEDDQGRPGPKKRRKVNGEFSVMRKRGKRKPGELGEAPPVKKKKRGRPKPSDDYDYFMVEPHKLCIDGSHAANPGISSLPASFFSGATAPGTSDYSVPTEIQFLMPNTHLEDDYIPEALSQAHETDASSPSNVSVQDKYPEPTMEPVIYADSTGIRSIPGKKGVWPNLSAKWFEQNQGSFAMKGWLPGRADQLVENVPKDMEQMADSIASHCKPEHWADPRYGMFCVRLDGCKAYELSPVGMRTLSGTVGPKHLFYNLSSEPSVSNMAAVEPQWLDETEWTLQTIPYEMLDDDDDRPITDFDVEQLEQRGAGRPRVRPLPKDPNRPKRKYVKKSEFQEFKRQRELTPYPQKPEDYFRKKGEQCHGVDWKVEDTRIAAYVAVSTLTGGINRAMDWGLMLRIFPEAKLSNMRRFWSMIKKEREGFINTLATKFQEDFLEAYENKDEHVYPFNFDEPLDYDWPKLVKWTLRLVVREGIELPPNRKQFDEELEVLKVDPNDFDWRETYYHWQRSVFNKFQDSTSEPAATVLDQTSKLKLEDNDAIIARSWIRALCCTEQDKDTAYNIRDKFKTLMRDGLRNEHELNDLLQATVFDLEHRRIAIKSRAKPLAEGRPYKLNEHFSSTLDRFSNDNRFMVAAEFKLKLDEAFKKGETVDIPWRTEDGMVLAAFNLQAAGRIRIEPIRKLDIPFGFKPGFYESRKFPKSFYRFDLHVRPTAAYLYNEQIEVLHRATRPDNIPAATDDGKLPMWCDFFGVPDRRRWFKMLAGVLFVLATRGAMTDEYATQALKPCFELFEVETVRKWGLEEGLLREVTVEGGAVTVDEWWWLVLGNPLLELAPASTTVAAAEAAAGASKGGRRTKDQYEEWNSGRSRRRGKYRTIF